MTSPAARVPKALARLGLGTRFFYGWAIVGAGLLTFLVGAGVLYQGYAVFFVTWEKQFGWSRAFLAGAISAGNLLTALVAPLLGRLCDTLGARRLLIFGGLLMGTGELLMGRITAPWHLYLFFLMAAAGFACMGHVPVTALVSRWFQRRRGTAVGLAQMGMGLGGVVIVPLAAALVLALGWRLALTVLALLVWGTIVPLAVLVVRSKPEDLGLLPDGLPPATAPASPSVASQSASAREASGMRLGEAVRTWQFWALTVVLTLNGGAGAAMAIHILPFMTDRGFSLATGSMGVSLASFGLVCSKFGLGFASDRLPSRAILIAAIVSLASAAIIFLAVSTGAVNRWVAFLAVVVLEPGSASTSVLMPVLLSSLFGARHLGGLIGAVFSLAMLGMAAGPLISGRIFDATGSYNFAFILYLGLMVVALALTLLLRPIVRKQAPSR